MGKGFHNGLAIGMGLRDGAPTEFSGAHRTTSGGCSESAWYGRVLDLSE